MALSTSGLETWILGLAQAVELATTDDCLPEESDTDSVVFEHELILDEDSAISSDMSVGVEFNEDDDVVSDAGESSDIQEEPDSTGTNHDSDDIKQRVILALEEFSNTILRKVVEIENKEKEKHDARLKLRNNEGSRPRNPHNNIQSPSPNCHEDLPDR